MSFQYQIPTPTERIANALLLEALSTTGETSANYTAAQLLVERVIEREQLAAQAQTLRARIEEESNSPYLKQTVERKAERVGGIRIN